MARGKKTGGGSRLGRPNKATANAREVIAAFVDKNSQRFETLLSKIEREDGARAAWDCIVDLIEFHVPKLARTEHTGKDGGPVVVKSTPLDEAL